MKYFISAIFILSSSYCYACSSIPSLYDSRVLGPRRVQYDSNLCYAFSISHVLSSITGRYVNPIDIAYKYKKIFGSAHYTNILDFQTGAAVNRLNANSVGMAIAQGLCSAKISSKSSNALRSTSVNRGLSKIEQIRSIQNIYNELIEETNKSCSSNHRFYQKGIRALGFGFGRPASLDLSPASAISTIDKLLERKTPVVLNVKNSIFNNNSRGLHSVALMGRRKNSRTQSCEYLILDSSPTDVCQKNSSAIKDKNCSKGELWIPKDRIIKYGVSLIGFRVR